MLTTEGIDHVSLEVHDPARSAEWYRAVFGLERRFEDAWGDVPTVMGAGSTNLALFPRSRSEEDPRPSRWSGHIAFRVDRETFARAPAQLAALGIEYREADYRISRSLHIADPDGYHIEITTYELGASSVAGDD